MFQSLSACSKARNSNKIKLRSKERERQSEGQKEKDIETNREDAESLSKRTLKIILSITKHEFKENDEKC